MGENFENYDQIVKGLNILKSGLAPYIAMELGNEFGNDWWQKGVLDLLYDEQKRNLPISGEWGALVDSLDVLNCLTLFSDVHWQQIFRRKFSMDHRNWANELKGVRNRAAHIGGEDISDDITWRALDTLARFDEQIDPEGAEEIRGMLRDFRYGSSQGSIAIIENEATKGTNGKAKAGIMSTTPVSNLLSWRDVIEPHPDVAQGRYKNAEFAADLAQVARGTAALEYLDPVEFFARTYVTEGMQGLLEQALRRVCGKDGEPVIQLKTAFGGGKTHSLLALYHMMHSKISVEKMPALKTVLEAAGESELPKANVAVLVGTALDPSKSKRPPNLPGVTINTLWGDMAAQLAVSAGKPELYDYIKEADKKGVSPGSETLKELFDAAAPSVILMDEVVAYAKKLYGAKDLPAGTFDNLISFIQELTEAARASENSLVVASIPESDIEIGGEAGQRALETIEHTFGRMEAIWKPVTANEGFEVVRRRLFLDCKNPDMRDKICSSFSRMYNENASDFPLESREVDYRERMIACYPIHPEVFDRLYNDWATLDRFQRTRGVLRLMAAVIYELWMGHDASLMIMPGSFSLDVPGVKNELTRYLDDNWNSVVDNEVDGKNSTPYRLDKEILRYGNLMAARRVARTVMLGSAPSVKEMNVRGIESSRILLGVAQPGENIPVFTDALNTLNNKLSYLYSNGAMNRFWYDTRPTLRKTAEDRASQQSASDVAYEIESRLRKFRKIQPVEGLHICPGSSLDVPDEQSCRLVILKPEFGYDGKEGNPAISKANDILSNRGSTPRIYRNMLVFIAADQNNKQSLEEEVRRYLAWQSINNDKEVLNLDHSQIREMQTTLARCDETVNLRINETYCWLITPRIDREVDIKTVVWDSIRFNGGSDDLVNRVVKKLINDQILISDWGPILLIMELDRLLWQDRNDLEIKTLWDQLCTYLYLPRLTSYRVLEETIKKGVSSGDFFGYAEGIENGRYLGLKIGQQLMNVEKSGLLVKKEVAVQQIQEETIRSTGTSLENNGDEARNQPWKKAQDGFTYESYDTTSNNIHDGSTLIRNRSFTMNAILENTRIGRDVQKLLDEVISHLMNEEGSDVEVFLVVEAKKTEGFSQNTVRTVSENCSTLRVRDSGFSDNL